MGKSQQLASRENWVDTVKIIACVVIVLGHFFQSMVRSDIIPETWFYGWFSNAMLYCYPVQIFFICSGYLFQKFTTVRSIGQWKNNFLKKFISFAVPYIVFSFVTYLMKVVFSDSVNREVGGLFDTLFLNPMSPYWYLYALIFIFLITISIKTNREAVIFIVAALVMKGLSFIPGNNIYPLKTVLENEIWFVLGMLICYCDIPTKLKKIKTAWAFLIAAVFVAVSLVVYRYTDWNDVIAFAMSLFGCFSVLLVVFKVGKSSRTAATLSKNTFPVYLMHTIFAAGFRSVLLKVGISNSVIHIVFGLIISFVGPVIVALVLEKLKYPEFLLYPNKFIRIGVRKNEQET